MLGEDGAGAQCDQFGEDGAGAQCDQCLGRMVLVRSAEISYAQVGCA